MARKPLMMVALISLVLLVQAYGSFADTYTYYYPSDAQVTGNYENSTWKHGYSDKNPWDAGKELYMGVPAYYSPSGEATFKVGFTNGSTTYLPYTNTNPGVRNLMGVIQLFLTRP